MRTTIARGVALALLLTPALAACSRGDATPEPGAAAPATSVGPVGAAFQSFASPCPTVGDRAGAKLDSSLDISISSTVDCSYGDTSKFPHVNSVSVINKPGNPKGTPEAVTEGMFEALKGKAQTNATDGISAEERPGLGDEAFLVISYKDNVALLVIRSANALIQASSTLDAEGDKEKALTALRAQEPTVTALGQALLADLR